MKKILLPLLIIILIAVAGVAYLAGSLNDIVKEQVETHGSKALQSAVVVEGVDIRLMDGFGELSDFSVANPNGFTPTSALGFGIVRLDIGTENITEMPIVIGEVLVDSLSALYELNAQGKGNLNVLLEQITSQASADSGKSGSADKTKEESGADSDVRIVIKKLTIKDTQLALDLSALGQKKYDETLPTFAVSNVGGSAGLPPKELAQAMGKQILDKLIKEAKAKQTEKLKAKAKEKLMEKLEEKGGDKLKGLMKSFGH
ncbi:MULTISPECIES: hypothetical protein [unclassified Oleiphilus]|uniref:hypothetical protein n=7 Tax=Oleiphilus TaxID=141450 RepID=UPI0007C29AD7|nr:MULTISPECIES: hypothetical protein [unclassified Oleiphilus]KZY46052.1 hypothetical protein A3732_08300 [Oleiphilus sp. HI0050]KZY73720.1 hypothetical protein A3740_18365 [Oleiphilus sp. HI0068]KZY78795.1 hypothetical protein A3741_08055 [Oleiphilus sp. HI0069]KZY87705.1 hypothetical protein A3743_13660 [Oleiphilus sp. HI0072]KZZ19224.1 hypothetical protein A3752_15245 [Oleiphilus sp. HI0081]